jgi:hypothetical protein
MRNFFIIENGEEGTQLRRIAFVYADDEAEAVEKVKNRFPKMIEPRFIRPSQIVQSYSTCIIR